MPGSLIHQIASSFKKITVPMLRENNPDRIINEHIPIKRGEAKFRGVADRYIFSYKTYDNYRDSAIVMSKWVKKEFPEVRELRDITPDMLTKYYEHRIEQKKSPWTIAADYSAMTKLNSALRSRNWIQEDIQPPKDSIDFPERTLENRTDRGPFTEEEFEKVLELVEERSPISGELMIFSYETGARYEGAMQLTADQVRIGDPNDPNEKGKYFVDLIEKGGKERKTEISASYYEYLQEKLEENNPDSNLPDNEKYVFPKMSDSNINKQIKQACKELDITDRKFHGIRGLSAVLKFIDNVEKGMDRTKARDEASEYLGHSSGRSISNYTSRT